MDRKDLKIQALLEKISSLTTQYENQAADMRVELTVQNSEQEQRVAEAYEKISALEEQVAALEEQVSGGEDPDAPVAD